MKEKLIDAIDLCVVGSGVLAILQVISYMCGWRWIFSVSMGILTVYNVIISAGMLLRIVLGDEEEDEDDDDGGNE